MAECKFCGAETDDGYRTCKEYEKEIDKRVKEMKRRRGLHE